jgi:cysteinyl-tRNA synthetase
MMKQGSAYNSNGSVYFDTSRHKQSHDYPKLVPSAGSGQTDAELAEGEGALGAKFEGEKRHRNDFALWKASKAGEPRWSSPWGDGRPGWHIECSVMIKEIHGPRLDIHGGGADLRFPHHDNEIAQAEAFHECQQWCNYFTHAGHLHIKGLKMSKSLKNFVTIRQALEMYTARQLRLMFLSHGWDRPLNFSDQSITEARDKESRLNSFFAVVETAIREAPIHSSPQKWDDRDRALHDALRAAQTQVHAHLCDNLNTPDAMDALDGIVSAVHTYLKGAAAAKAPLLRACADYVRRILGVFGVVLGADAGGGGAADTAAAAIEAFVKHRDALRQLAMQTKNADLMRMCDSLRDEAFVDLGVRVADREAGLGALWSREDAAALRKEAEDKAAERREKERQKAANLLALKEKELAKLEAARADPKALFRADARFAAWDDAGLPTQVAGGEPVPKSLGKTCAKEMDRYVKDHEALAAKGGDAYLEELRAEAAALRAVVGPAPAP